DAPRGTRAAHALRDRDEHRSHAGGSGPAVLGDPRAHPADRGEGAGEAEASEPVAGEAEFSGAVARSSACARIGHGRSPAQGTRRKGQICSAYVLDRPLPPSYAVRGYETPCHAPSATCLVPVTQAESGAG